MVPPILHLLDDPALESKVKGCELLTQLLAITPLSLLQKTGLGEVFTDALLPSLVSVPPLTTEAESIELLPAVYTTLLRLVIKRYPDPDSQERVRLLYKVLRTGILQPCGSVPEYARVEALLMAQLVEIVHALGTWSVRHLRVSLCHTQGYMECCLPAQDIWAVLKARLTNPFASASYPLLDASIKALQTVILTDWPRIDRYAGEILLAIGDCYGRLVDDSPSAAGATSKRLLDETLWLLRAALVEQPQILEEIEEALRREPRLTGLVASEADWQRRLGRNPTSPDAAV